VQQKNQGDERRQKPKDLMVFLRPENLNIGISFFLHLTQNKSRIQFGSGFFLAVLRGSSSPPGDVDHKPWPEFLQPLSDIPVLRGLVLPAQG